MSKESVWVASIHDAASNGVQLCELKELLGALGEYRQRWVWCITELDAFGHAMADNDEVEAACSSVVASNGKGLWLSWDELAMLAERIDQTIDGVFLAFPRGTDRATVQEPETALSGFPSSKAEMVIHVIDSTLVDVYAKDSSIFQQLRKRFRDVREENPRMYFGAA